MPKLAFISVFDKTGLLPVAEALVKQHGYTLLSTGGTADFLTRNGLPVQETSDITGFTDLLGGRVKSLHPTLFGAILAEGDQAEPQGLPFLFDTVIVNLYPFEAERDNPEAPEDPNHLLHFIDIGGSALMRAAAKNHPRVTLLCDPGQYDGFLAELAANQGETTLAYRQARALDGFRRSVAYDTAIAGVLAARVPAEEDLPCTLPVALQKIEDLRYGENPHQAAALYGLNTRQVDFTLLHGKPLSYNNLLDFQSAWDIVTEFRTQPACAIIKHNNPCGVALANRPMETGALEAFRLAFDADPLSAFGGVVAFNCPVTGEAAEMMKAIFLEVIVAPAFTPEARELLETKKNLRLVERPMPAEHARPRGPKLTQLNDQLYLAQTPSTAAGPLPMEAMLREGPASFDPADLTVVTDSKPQPEHWSDLAFAWAVVKHVKSNAIVLAKGGRTVGIGCGQTSRIGALEHALKMACDEAKDAVMASDGFLPQEDNLHAAAQARVGAIIQPGGSIKDPDVIALANRYQIPMVTTGRREFKH